MAEKQRIGVAIAAALDVQGYTAEGLGVAKVVRRGFLGGNDAAGGLFAIENPEPYRSIVVLRVVVDVLVASTAACTINVGTSPNNSTASTNLINAASVAATGVIDNINSAGVAGKSVQSLGPGGYLTASTASGASAGLAAIVMVEYLLV